MQEKIISLYHPNILFLSGASGVGKTTIVNALRSQNTSAYHFFLHFDSIDVPSLTDIIESAGSVEKWQEITTYKWIEKIANEYHITDTVIIEGQVRLNFIEDACRKFGVTRYTIILIDCDWKIMRDRLINNRQQPELVNSNMQNWANFLRQQAQFKNISIINTSQKTLQEVVDMIQNQVLTSLVEAR
ncbi:AAA family ATPase [Nostoc sp. CCCryo 231-06]|nr:AAA family ATPase [Nostoc sp. CCCryo 231-06]